MWQPKILMGKMAQKSILYTSIYDFVIAKLSIYYLRQKVLFLSVFLALQGHIFCSCCWISLKLGG